MLTPFGKCLRMMRLDRGELLKDMAETLGVSPAYLSTIENGKKPPTQELINRLQSQYILTAQELSDIEDAHARTTNAIVFNFESEIDGDLGIMFARRLNKLSAEQKNRIAGILNNKE